MSQAAIRAALEQRIEEWASGRPDALPIAWQNQAFSPDQGQTYLRVFVLPARTTAEDLAGVYRVYRGVLQISIVTPTGGGAGPAEAIAAEIESLFPVNLRLAAGGRFVQMMSPMSIATAIPEPDACTVPVSAEYRCDDI